MISFLQCYTCLMSARWCGPSDASSASMCFLSCSPLNRIHFRCSRRENTLRLLICYGSKMKQPVIRLFLSYWLQHHSHIPCISSGDNNWTLCQVLIPYLSIVYVKKYVFDVSPLPEISYKNTYSLFSAFPAILFL